MMAFGVQIEIIVLFTMISVFLSIRQITRNLRNAGEGDRQLKEMSWDLHNTSYWKLLETTIPCAVILLIVVNLSSGPCRDTPIECRSNYNMHFISCDLQKCKYSEHLECNLLPCLALICHAFVVASTYDTLQMWNRRASSLSAFLAYTAVLGFAGVILFDSRTSVALESSMHFACVSGLTFSVLAAACHVPRGTIQDYYRDRPHGTSINHTTHEVDTGHTDTAQLHNNRNSIYYCLDLVWGCVCLRHTHGNPARVFCTIVCAGTCYHQCHYFSPDVRLRVSISRNIHVRHIQTAQLGEHGP